MKEQSSPSNRTEEYADEPHTDRHCIHVGIINVGYGGSDLWEGAILIDNVEVEFHPAGKKNGYGGSVVGLT